MTPADLKTAALRELKVISSTDDAGPEDFALMGQKYAGLYAQLREAGLVTWPISGDVPKNAEQPVVMMLAAFSAVAFGIQDPDYTRLQLAGAFDLPSPSLAERQLRKALASRYVSHEAQPDYF